ncbi:MAG: MBL fold metallo-hydrolase [Deltaproteobacteria bacterium]|nr:MBL fold metallo-hydrolase [Deltaproteobacteria bacterium]
MKITFLGAAGTVTGSKFLLETGKQRILIDAGLFQGFKELRVHNWQDLPFDPRSLDAVIITHAHIDHTGYLPALCKHGFIGPIYSTAATKELCEILLPDAGYLQEEEARFANKHGFSKHQPALPLFTVEDARHALALFEQLPFHAWHELGNKLSFQFTPAGHLLGAACIHLKTDQGKLVVSGDIGRSNDLLIKPPEPVRQADYLLLESTYGNKDHQNQDPLQAFEDIIHQAWDRKGVILIPAFAVGRVQAVLHILHRLKREGRIPEIPIYLDSPMAILATEVFCRYTHEHRLTADEARALAKTAKAIESQEESKMLSQSKGPKLIVSASGMATGGRVLHHLKWFAPDPQNTILFVGFQSPGTRGEAMVNGATKIRVHGQDVSVRAKVVHLENLSAHADRNDIVRWLAQMKRPQKVILVHGEPSALLGMQAHLMETLRWPSVIPKYGETIQF